MNNQIMSMTNTTATMSSLEIAELTGKQHSHVLRDIENILGDADIGASKFGGTYISKQNKELPCYHLPRFECDLVVSGYSVKYRAAIIKRWHELEAKEARPLSNMEMIAKMAMEQHEANLRLENMQKEIAEVKAKAEKSNENYYTVAGYASLRGINIDVKKAAFLGRKAVKKSKDMDLPVNDAHSTIFGKVNTYHVDVLCIIFKDSEKELGL